MSLIKKRKTIKAEARGEKRTGTEHKIPREKMCFLPTGNIIETLEVLTAMSKLPQRMQSIYLEQITIKQTKKRLKISFKTCTRPKGFYNLVLTFNL